MWCAEGPRQCTVRALQERTRDTLVGGPRKDSRPAPRDALWCLAKWGCSQRITTGDYRWRLLHEKMTRPAVSKGPDRRWAGLSIDPGSQAGLAHCTGTQPCQGVPEDSLRGTEGPSGFPRSCFVRVKEHTAPWFIPLLRSDCMLAPVVLGSGALSRSLQGGALCVVEVSSELEFQFLVTLTGFPMSLLW